MYQQVHKSIAASRELAVDSICCGRHNGNALAQQTNEHALESVEAERFQYKRVLPT